ncbi:CD99 molecule isoform X1 [Epinephelus fuscoguttatus]|uniref:CD99 molecule isoform X1 n=1 Tax=Epinephelus fuscoguttatus TaxID=293821 RepID=UPI0020D15AB2|nr:CD99 molecule isoform X1 [Epinephelus fuscoguttatus]
MLRLRIILLLCLVTGALTQDLFDLSDALDDVKPATPKPEQPKAPEKPKDDGGFGFNLDDALGPDTPKPAKPTVKPPKSGGGGGFEFNLDDALGPDANPPKPTVKPPNRGGGGEANPGYNSHGGAADEPQAAGTGQIAGIASAVGMALLGAASSYFAYQKKKLCFKAQGGADPERGKVHHGNQSDGTQIFSNLLRTS